MNDFAVRTRFCFGSFLSTSNPRKTACMQHKFATNLIGSGLTSDLLVTDSNAYFSAVAARCSSFVQLNAN